MRPLNREVLETLTDNRQVRLEGDLGVEQRGARAESSLSLVRDDAAFDAMQSIEAQFVSRPMRILIFAALFVHGCGCGPQCRDSSGPAQVAFCEPAHAGQSFTCSAVPESPSGSSGNFNFKGSCRVQVGDGGVDFFVDGDACDRLPLPGPVETAQCEVPALSPGLWRVGRFQLDLPADGGFANARP